MTLYDIDIVFFTIDYYCILTCHLSISFFFFHLTQFSDIDRCFTFEERDPFVSTRSGDKKVLFRLFDTILFQNLSEMLQ
ncbi:hypothetical protein D1872_264330 [compost metagenome]